MSCAADKEMIVIVSYVLNVFLYRIHTIIMQKNQKEKTFSVIELYSLKDQKGKTSGGFPTYVGTRSMKINL